MRVFLDEGAPMKALIQRGKKDRRWEDVDLSNYLERLLAAF
jgi:hypothetical protein